MLLFVLGGITPAICEIWLKKKYSTKEEFKSFIHNVKNPKHPVSCYIFVIGLAFAAFFTNAMGRSNFGESNVSGVN